MLTHITNSAKVKTNLEVTYNAKTLLTPTPVWYNSFWENNNSHSTHMRNTHKISLMYLIGNHIFQGLVIIIIKLI